MSIAPLQLAEKYNQPQEKSIFRLTHTNNYSMWMAAILAAILKKVCRKLITWINFLYFFISTTDCPESSEHIAVSYISEQCPPVAKNGSTFINV